MINIETKFRIRHPIKPLPEALKGKVSAVAVGHGVLLFTPAEAAALLNISISYLSAHRRNLTTTDLPHWVKVKNVIRYPAKQLVDYVMAKKHLVERLGDLIYDATPPTQYCSIKGELMDHSLLTIAQVSELLSIKKQTLYAYVQQGIFPKPIKITGRCARWLPSEISEWVNNLSTDRIKTA